MITIGGMPFRALPDGSLMNHRDALAAEVMFWRGEVASLNRTLNTRDAELQKAEATIRNQDVELRRLRMRVTELSSI